MVGQLSAGERGEEGEGLQLVRGLRARHVRVQVAHCMRVVESTGQTTAVRETELWIKGMMITKAFYPSILAVRAKYVKENNKKGNDKIHK